MTVRVSKELTFEQVPEPNPAAVKVIVIAPVEEGVNVGFNELGLSNVPPVLDQEIVE